MDNVEVKDEILDMIIFLVKGIKKDDTQSSENMKLNGPKIETG